MNHIVVSGYAYPAVQDWVLESWLPDLTFLGNFSYGITEDGGVIGLQDQKLIEAARKAGVQPMMVLTQLDQAGSFNSAAVSALLADHGAQAVLIENIRKTLQTKNLAGVDFDFEFIPVERRADYEMLLRQAKEVLGADGFYVTAALPPKISGEQRGSFYEAYDYRTIGAAVDYVLLMTYEWGYTYKHQ